MDFSEIAEITGDFRKDKDSDDDGGSSAPRGKPPKPSAKQIQAAAVNLSPEVDNVEDIAF